MKILLTIHHELSRNAGAPGVTWQLGQEYQKLGHEVQYYTFDNLPPRLPGLIKALIFPILVALRISILSTRKSVDVVDAATGDAWLWAKTIRSLRKNSPLLVTRSHGLEHTLHLKNLEEVQRGNLSLSWKYPLYHGGFRLWEVVNSLRGADLVLLLNQHDLEYATQYLRVKPPRAHVIANGIPNAFLNLSFEQLPEAETCVVGIAQIGSYILRKGIQYSTPALNAILRRHPQVKVSFLGTGCSEAEVCKDFEPAVRARIRVVPRYDHEMLPSLLRNHQIKLFPTLFEGFSLALIEAMACGLAPVTTATPGSLDLVRDGHDAIVIPARNSQSIEQALERLITDRPYLESMRRNAHATAQRYSWTRIACENLALYEESLHQRRCSR